MKGKKKKCIPKEQTEANKVKKDPGKVRKRGRWPLKRQLTSDLIRLALLGVWVFLLLFLVFGVSVARGSAMEPDLKDGDVLLYYRLSKDFAQRDAVLYTAGGQRRTGRIAAGPGDQVSFTPEGRLVINGYCQTALNGTDTYVLPDGAGTYPLTLGTGEYFILAEDKENTEDSRSYGAIEKEDVRGKIITILRRRSI